MADFQKAEDGDILLQAGDLVLLTGAAAIQQAIEFELSVGLAECPYATNNGTPWIQILFLDSTTDEARKFILREVVLRVDGVIDAAIVDLVVNAQTKEWTASGTALTTEGPITFNTDGSAKNGL